MSGLQHTINPIDKVHSETGDKKTEPNDNFTFNPPAKYVSIKQHLTIAEGGRPWGSAAREDDNIECSRHPLRGGTPRCAPCENLEISPPPGTRSGFRGTP